jgi:RNA polymerase sigma-70 factor (ECF subfamily)
VTDNNDILVIQKVLAGDVHAYTILVDRYKHMAVGLAFNILLNREDAEEAAQDAFVKAFQGLYGFKASSKFSTWLYRIIVNTALNKKKGKKQQTIILDESFYEELQDENDSFLSLVINKPGKGHIQAALRELSDNERICISLFYLEELSVEEINEVTAISVSNIKVLLHRGRKRLLNVLQHQLKNEITDLI